MIQPVVLSFLYHHALYIDHVMNRQIYLLSLRNMWYYVIHCISFAAYVIIIVSSKP